MEWTNRQRGSLVVVFFLGFMLVISHGFHFSFSINHKKYRMHMAVNRNRNREYNDFTASSPKNIIASDSFLHWVSSRTGNTGIIPVGTLDGTLPEDAIHENKLPIDATDASAQALRYFSRMESVAPNDMISSFARSAPKLTQDAVMLTIVNLFGKFPTFALDAILMTTKIKLAELFFQMQLTGYLFKNAEYRMSMMGTLKGLPKVPNHNEHLRAINMSRNIALNEIKDVKGEIVVQTIAGGYFPVDAAELVHSLKDQITILRDELLSIKAHREEELSVNFLTYIQSLPEQDIIKLTSDMSRDVLEAIHLLVKTITDRIGEGAPTPEVPMQQNAGYLAQLCIWHMVMGYRLREMEVLDLGISLDY